MTHFELGLYLFTCFFFGVVTGRWLYKPTKKPLSLSEELAKTAPKPKKEVPPFDYHQRRGIPSKFESAGNVRCGIDIIRG